MTDPKWKPVAREREIKNLSLTAEEGFVLSRIDGSTSMQHLSAVTGMKQHEVEKIVNRLARFGAIERPPIVKPGMHAIDPDPTLDDAPAIEETHPHRTIDATQSDQLRTQNSVEQTLKLKKSNTTLKPSPEELAAIQDALLEFDDDDESDVFEANTPRLKIKTNTSSAVPLAEDDGELYTDDNPQESVANDFEDEDEKETLALAKDDIERFREEAQALVDAENEEANDAASDEKASDEEAGDEEKLSEGNLRRLYQELYAKMSRDERGQKAHTESGNALSALCFDPDPGIIRALLENSHSGLSQARLISEHHRNATGLSHLTKRTSYLRDAQVQKFLLRNNQTPEGLFNRLLLNKPLPKMYQLTLSREVTQRAKRHIRQAFRKTFARAQPDARAALIFKTEGRCLANLIGMPLDSKTAGLLSTRAIQSTMLIQNLARFPSTPPTVITHLLKQPGARRAPHLKNALLKHPNCPTSAKRSMKKR